MLIHPHSHLVTSAYLLAALWTSTAVDSYLCCTAHWIDSDWYIQNLVIACDNYFGVDHSGESVARLIRGIWQDYGITKERVALVVTDSAANMNTFGSLLRCPAVVRRRQLCHR
jgi:hypothetical protein